MPKSTPDLSSKQRKEQLSHDIAAVGFIMPTRCFHCEKAGTECKVDIRSGRCSECARHGQSCNQQVTRIEYEKIRKIREKISKELEEAEEEEDKLTRKLLEHRSRVRRLRKQLRLKEVKELQAQEREAEAIAEAEVLERELLPPDPVPEPIPLDLPSFVPSLFDDRLLMDPRSWSALDGAPWETLGFEAGGTPVEASGSS
jgi:hypothetical protein